MPAFQGRGAIKIADFSSGATFGARIFRDIGNADVFKFSFSEEKKEQLDYQDPAGGTAASVTKISSVNGDIQMLDFKAENLALALWGTTTAANATAIVAEAIGTIVPGRYIPTARLINTSVAPVVKKGATVILAADYVVSAGGITIAATITTGTVISGDAITIDYTPLAGNTLQALVSSAPNVSIYFEGINIVTGKPSVRRIHKAKLGVASGVDFIGEDFGNLPITFTMEKDTTITTAGLSKFFSGEDAS
jgi:hypothetical protein